MSSQAHMMETRAYLLRQEREREISRLLASAASRERLAEKAVYRLQALGYRKQAEEFLAEALALEASPLPQKLS